MELQFEKTPLHCLKTVVYGVQEQEKTQEIKLSEAMPDVGRVIGCWGQVILRSKAWQESDVSASGGVTVWTLYAPEDGTAPRTLESWIPFQMKWDLPDDTAEGVLRVDGRLRLLDGRSVSPRKILLRAVVALCMEAFAPEELSLYQPGELPEDVALLQNTYPVSLPTQAGEKPFFIEEELTVPEAEPTPEKLVYAMLHPRITEKKVLGTRAVFRGEGRMHILYLSEEGTVQSHTFSLPFSQLGELEGDMDGEETLDVSLSVTDLDVTLDPEGHIRLKCGLTAQYVLENRALLTLTEDAYSPLRVVEPGSTELELPARLDSCREMLTAEQTVSAVGDHVADVVFYPDFPREHPVENGVRVALSGQFQILYDTADGALQCATGRWEGEHTVAADENCRIFAKMQLTDVPVVAMGDGGVQTRIGVELSTQAVSTAGIPMITGLELGEYQEPDPARPSLILRRVGEQGLWALAKAAGSTVEAIRLANQLEGEPEKGRMLLIPVV